MKPTPLFVGIDLGTSGCRAIAIDSELDPVANTEVAMEPPQRHADRSEQDPEQWWRAVIDVMADLSGRVDPRAIEAIVVDGTSGSILLTDGAGIPLTPGVLYNDARAKEQAKRIAEVAPANCGAHGPTSGLAKLLYLQGQPGGGEVRHVLNQADWIAARLCGRYGFGDENNCLKLGYDVLQRRWPDWLDTLQLRRDWLPQVVAPGTTLGTVSADIGRLFNLAPQCRIVAGTTDSIAGFIATGACRSGEAVTSLGSTLVIKILSDTPLFAPEYGIYSHRLGERWLAGGASNSGGAVLRRHFSQAELDALTPHLDPEHPTGLDYYPLLTPGERFPQCDPELAPRLTPRPPQDRHFFQGMLEGMARIEAAGYRRLATLGAPFPVSVRTVGGGAVNAAWTRIRARELHVPMVTPRHHEAAYGAALLAAGRWEL